MFDIGQGAVALDNFVPCQQNAEVAAFQIWWDNFEVNGLTGRPGDYLILCEDGSMYPMARELFEKVFK